MPIQPGGRFAFSLVLTASKIKRAARESQFAILVRPPEYRRNRQPNHGR
jgi:hypothetical protein